MEPGLRSQAVQPLWYPGEFAPLPLGARVNVCTANGVYFPVVSPNSCVKFEVNAQV